MASTIRAVPSSPPRSFATSRRQSSAEMQITPPTRSCTTHYTLQGAPQLAFHEQLTPLAMDGNMFSKSPSSISSPNLLNNRPRPSSSRALEDVSPNTRSTLLDNTLATPNRPVFPRHATTHANYTLASLNTPSRPSLPLSPQSSPPSADSPKSPSSDPNSAAHTPSAHLLSTTGTPSNLFSSAVGRATLGKSGRVIEKLMSDIDRLKRDLQLETARRQEMERREEANKSSMVQLAAEIVNLERAREGDVAALERRTRKVEELRTELETERGRRVRAEEEASASKIEAEARVTSAEAVVEGAVARQEQAQTELAVQQASHTALHAEYAKRTTMIERSFGEVLQEAEVARLKTTRLDVVLEQMQVELERTTRANEAMSRTFEEYRAVKEKEVERLRKKAEENEGEDERQREEAAKVLEDARWLITMGRRSVGMSVEKVDGKRS